MKVALIPPVPMLGVYGDGPFHLLLSHLCATPGYKKHYVEQRKNGAYLVLDNSAHEHGEGQTPGELALLAEKLDAQEVVVPDVLFDSEGTISRALEAHEVWFEDSNSSNMFGRQLMYVPQGRTKHEWSVCMKELIRMHLYSVSRNQTQSRFTLGISKDYEEWGGGLLHLLHEYVLPQQDALSLMNIKMDVHMLGWGRNLWALPAIARRCKWIRSIDSAKPLVYAINEIMLDPTESQPYPGRPDDYFKQKIPRRLKDVAEYNCRVFYNAAQGND